MNQEVKSPFTALMALQEATEKAKASYHDFLSDFPGNKAEVENWFNIMIWDVAVCINEQFFALVANISNEDIPTFYSNQDLVKQIPLAMQDALASVREFASNKRETIVGKALADVVDIKAEEPTLPNVIYRVVFEAGFIFNLAVIDKGVKRENIEGVLRDLN